MDWKEILFGSVLVVLLVALAGYYAWCQVQTLRKLRDVAESAPEEQRYLRRRAWRRLVGCGLMIVLALMLAGLMLFLEERAKVLADAAEAALQRGEALQLDEDQKRLKVLYGWWAIGLLLALLAVVTTAAIDMFATRRFGLAARRRIMADRRAMIERTVARMRQERNGHQ